MGGNKCVTQLTIREFEVDTIDFQSGDRSKVSEKPVDLNNQPI